MSDQNTEPIYTLGDAVAQISAVVERIPDYLLPKGKLEESGYLWFKDQNIGYPVSEPFMNDPDKIRWNRIADLFAAEATSRYMKKVKAA